MPRSAEVSIRTSISIMLTWEPPEDMGGRDDLSYQLCREVAGMEREEKCTIVVETTGTITGMVTK
jgi:hypothetical protein